MVKHPISVKRPSYRGSDPRKREKMLRLCSIANQLEGYINSLLLEQEEPIENYMYYLIASDTGIDESVVRDLCFSIDGGHHGFTVIRHDLTYEQAMHMIRHPGESLDSD